ncbi:hypothetical protein HanRHA438_Chr09g0382771 [Helianthus annuus]|uniref:Uncharacterized protein n=1 Tax=Helianthus annuus TaxID=4232 RepID=A0A251TVL9_HELAN|nr:uncharacterized protein LOC110877495 [Helianthus annuus]KAF5789433.1 hypothetical protein HanXRQr2_Chr09g0371181 [Helianthus annuus]KAJ0524822.1 hypothetical protein HanHA300_Chr09g0304961 [Helianthus annuus]KAJ0541157.1 hypothetical protein HanHA89_Chr09g0325271 [Helianthus annuus]KAJ0706240.1 hypothetical protein HanLR1_Chr09g0304781 [Helianthus annuus]KAJ0752205.1 hypothetical protein HanPI659440_Chr09g0321661 [Helianthus annuus]
MSHPNPTSPPPRLSKPPPPLHKQKSLSTDFYPPPPPLDKQKSLSTDFYREETWLRRKDNHRQHHRHNLHRRSKSVITTEDINELKGCVDLGFHFASEPNKLSRTLPALDLYYATLSPPTPSASSSTTTSNYGDSPPQPCSPATGLTAAATLFNSGENPEMVKRRLKQWAQVVACAARQPACHQADFKD